MCSDSFEREEDMMTRTLIGIAGLAIAASASANIPAQITGGGGVIPASGTGGGGVWQSSLPTDPTVTSGSSQIGVKSVKALTLHGLTHTWSGDLQVVLTAPDGSRHNIFVRPGFTGTGFGNSGDFNFGDYTFVSPGANPTLAAAGAHNPGTYSQSFGLWTDGNLGISNTPLSAISAQSAGVWSVSIYDWAGGDFGSFTGWTLDVNLIPAPGAAAMLGLAGLAGIRRRR
jgi:hypothetical protein